MSGRNVSKKTAFESFVFVIIALIACSSLLYCLLELVNIDYKKEGKFPVTNELSEVVALSIFYIPAGFFLARFLNKASGFNYHILFYSFSSLFIWLVVHLMVAFGPQFNNLITYAHWISIFFAWQVAGFIMRIIMRKRED